MSKIRREEKLFDLRRFLVTLRKTFAWIALGVGTVAALIWFSPPFATWLYVWGQGLSEPVKPFKIADNVYYVGSSDLAAYLFEGDQGDILVDGGAAETAAQILANVRALGKDPHDIAILLNTHGHFDHAAGLAAIKAATGAQLLASPNEKLLLESGGRGDYMFGDHMSYTPVKVDRVLADREVVKLGALELTAQFTPGHTKGCTSWTTQVKIDGGKPKYLVLNCSLTVLRGALAAGKDYPDVVGDYESTLARFEHLPCDILLAPHAHMIDLERRRALIEKGKHDAFDDPAACASFVANGKASFLNAKAQTLGQ